MRLASRRRGCSKRIGRGTPEVIVTLACATMLGAPATSPAAVDFGSNLQDAASGANGCAEPSCTMWNGALHSASTQGSLTAPISGVVVSFTVKKDTAGSAGWTPIHLRVLEHAGGSFWSGLGASADVVPTSAPGLETFPVRVPIEQGQYVGTEQVVPSGSSAFAVANGVFGATRLTARPGLPSDGTPTAPLLSATSELLLQARIEPDSDDDGFGDETQDLCPTDASTQGDCAPPDTTITTGPNKTRRSGRHSG